jgi:hypothetical protein
VTACHGGIHKVYQRHTIFLSHISIFLAAGCSKK